MVRTAPLALVALAACQPSSADPEAMENFQSEVRTAVLGQLDAQDGAITFSQIEAGKFACGTVETPSGERRFMSDGSFLTVVEGQGTAAKFDRTWDTTCK